MKDGELINLNPRELWENFQILCSIPRLPKKEKKAAAFVKEFGEKLGLETIVDAAGNVIIKKPASKGMENRGGVILQAHLDMVPQKNSGIEHDFEKDPIRAYVDGEWVKARETTLGADNGIGVAAAMAVLQSTDVRYGPVEALFTVDEEVGMTGAFNLKPSILTGGILLNTDSEMEGELCVGCAGGVNANITFRYVEEKVPGGFISYSIKVSGLKGGHSGVNINLGRGNANKILNRFLRHAAKKYGLRLSVIEGGNMRNAIPRESFAVAIVPGSKIVEFLDYAREFEKIVKNELAVKDPCIRFEVKQSDMPDFVMDEKTQSSMINAVYGCPNGVIAASDDMPDVVETSTNLAVVKSQNREITVLCLLRSSVESSKEDLSNMVESVFELAGADCVFEGSYPGWKANLNSPALRVMKESYEKKFGKTPEIKAIHAGLECGIIKSAYPELDMISFGPTICFPHSPDEKVNIKSVGRFWELLVETLKNIPEK